MKSHAQSGQILLITLLMLTIATTVGLSLIARTTTDITISNQTEESARALAAAEAGIEAALGTGSASGGVQVLSPGVSYDVTKVDIGGGTGIYMLPRATAKGQTDIVWLAQHNDSTGAIIETPYYITAPINVCWNSQAALVVSALYKESTDGSYKVARIAYDSNATRRASNQFASASVGSGCGSGTNTDVKEAVSFPADLGINPAVDTVIALRLRPIYDSSQLGIDPTGNLPKQGNTFESVGNTGTGVTRKVVVNQLYRGPSALFDYVIYSQSGSFGHDSPQSVD